MRAWLRKRYLRWLEKRLPRSNHVELHQGNLFIFLNRHALFYLGVCLLLWIGASNFENNLIYSLCFFMMAVVFGAIMLTFHNLSKLKIVVLPPEPVFAGDVIRLPLQLQSNKWREQLQWQFDGMPLEVISTEQDSSNLQVMAPAMQRGRHLLPRLKLSTTYPLGIIQCWTFLYPAQPAWVYPKPLACDIQRCNAGSGQLTGTAALSGSDEFFSLKAYRPGDSLVRIAWKQFAAGRGLLVSEYEASQQSGDWQLDYEQLTDQDPEVRLSKLCYAVLTLTQQGQAFSLTLPQTRIAQGSGAQHEAAALKALASFGGANARV